MFDYDWHIDYMFDYDWHIDEDLPEMMEEHL